MTPETDLLVDRRRLKRHLAVWRILGIVALLVAVLVALDRFGGGASLRDHVARLTVDGFIAEDRDMIEAIERVAEDPRAKALVVRIDSPGGTFVGGESLFRALRRVAETKPVVAVMGTLATSAAYMTALGADRVFAHDGTITGSIGVIMQTTDVTRLLDKLGVSAEAIKSGPLKAAPSPFEPLTDEVRAAVRAIIDDMHALFMDMVVSRRGLSPETVRVLADGRVYSGRQAVENRLVDAIGDEIDARAWLASEKGVPASLPVFDARIRDDESAWLPKLSAMSRKILFSERLTLDGLVSVWQPDLE